MQIHGNYMNPNAASLYTAAATEKAAAAQRAAEVRKKLISSGSMIEGEAEAEEVSMIGQEKEKHSHQRRQRRPRSSGNKKSVDDEQSEKPMSIWG